MTVTISIKGESCQLWGDKVLFLQQSATLLIADIHLGKGAVFRDAGVPIPTGISQTDLTRISILLEQTNARRIIFLGDFWHAKASNRSYLHEQLKAWRDKHPAIECILIRGNHDKPAGDPPAFLNIRCVSEPYCEYPFAFTHHPEAIKDHYVLAGHIHPVIYLFGKGKEKLRLPCFYFTENVGILPSFGSFTGGYAINPKINSQVFVVADGQVITLSNRGE